MRYPCRCRVVDRGVCAITSFLLFAATGGKIVRTLSPFLPTYIEVRARCKNLHRNSVSESGRSSIRSDSERDIKQESILFYLESATKQRKETAQYQKIL